MSAGLVQTSYVCCCFQTLFQLMLTNVLSDRLPKVVVHFACIECCLVHCWKFGWFCFCFRASESVAVFVDSNLHCPSAGFGCNS